MLKIKSPVISSIFSLILPGLGQVYNSQPVKGIVIYLIGIVGLLIYSLSKIQYHFYGLVVLVLLSLFYYLYAFIDSIIVSRRSSPDEPKSYNKWYVYLLILLLSAIVNTTLVENIINEFLSIKSYKLPAGSMRPTMDIGDYFISNMHPFAKTKPDYGDIIVFSNPQNKANDLVKRVVAIPGDLVEIKDKKLFVNGKLQNEPYVIHLDPESNAQRDDYGPLAIPVDTYFVLGDNRDNSFDSRFFGPVSVSDIKGKALYFYWSKTKDKIGKTIK